MAFIGMDRYHDLIIRQVFPRKLLRDLQSEFRCDFSRLIGDDNVVALPAFVFAEVFFGVPHLAIFVTRVTVQSCGQYLFLRFVAVQDIPNRLIRSGSPAFDFVE